jgi:GTP-sensing pleiotropic transcriptional regulator CodY
MVTENISMPDRDESSGRYSESFPSERFVDAIEALGGAAGTQEIADQVGCQYRTAYGKLRDLESDGRVTSRKVGNARLWSVADGLKGEA